MGREVEGIPTRTNSQGDSRRYSTLVMRFTSPVGVVAEIRVDGIESRALIGEHRRISMSLQSR